MSDTLAQPVQPLPPMPETPAVPPLPPLAQQPVQQAAQPGQQLQQVQQVSQPAQPAQPAQQVQPAQPSILSQAQAGQPPQQAQPELQLDPADMPIQDWSKVDLELGDAVVDGKVVESYGKLACDLGLTPRQARALAAWQMDICNSITNANVQAETDRLRSDWGLSFNNNITQVDNLCQRISRLPGLGDFHREIQKSGAAANATVVKGLHYIACLLSEDSMGRVSGQAPRPETAEEGIADAFARARGELR